MEINEYKNVLEYYRMCGEMNFLSNGMNVIICIFEIYILYDLYKSIFKERKNSKKIQIVSIIMMIFSILCINYLEVSVINIVCMAFITAVLGHIFFNVTIKLSLIYSILYCIVSSVVEMVGGVLYRILIAGRLHSSSDFSLSFFIFLLLEKGIIYVSLKFWQFSDRKSSINFMGGIYLCFYILPISTFFIMYGIMQFDFTTNIIFSQKLLLVIGCTMMIVSNIFVYYLLEKFSDIFGKNKEIEIMKTKVELDHKHYEKLEKAERECQEYIHDMHKNLSIIGVLVADKQYDYALNFLGELDIKLYEINRKHYCYDRILNAILMDKINEAKREKIDIYIYIDPIISLDGIDELDKIAMVGNLLDNAIEAVIKCRLSKIIKIDIKKGNDSYVTIRICNTYSEKLVKVGGNYITGKVDKANHGIGIKRVRKIAERYGGILHINDKNGWFVAELYLVVN